LLQYLKKYFILSIGCFIWLCSSLLSGCNYGKHVSADESLLWQNRVIVRGKYKAADQTDLLNQLNAGIVQTPNTALFGLDLETWNMGYYMPRVKLNNYNLFYKKITQKKDSSYLRNNIVQLPVIYDANKTKFSIKNLKLICNNNGFTFSNVYDSVVTKKNKRTCVYYIVNTGKNYTTKSVNYTYNTPNTEIDSILQANRKQTFLKWDEPLTRTNVSLERTRLASLLIENGFYNFRQSAIEPTIDTADLELIQAIDNPFEQIALMTDTNFINKKPVASVTFNFSDSINNEKIKRYYIGKIEVEVQESNGLKSKSFAPYAQLMYKDIAMYNMNKYLKPEVIYNNIYIKSGQLFSSTQIDATLNKLKNFNAFLNVRVDLKPVADTNIVNCIIVLTMNKKYEIQYDIETSRGKQYDLGVGFKAGIKNNNVFKKGYQLNTSVQFGVQSLLNRTDTGGRFQLWELNGGISTDLKIPQFLLPSFLQLNMSNKQPQTNIGFSVNRYQRPSAFTQSTANGQITYSWNQTKRMSWKVTPAFLTFVQTSNQSDDFQTQIASSPSLKIQLQPYTIFGSTINFEYTNRLPRFQYFYTYYRVNVEKAGSLLNTFYKDANNAQYAKVEMELKHYINSLQGRNWVNRIYIYAGIPIKNNTLPYIKQQNIGGPFSLRGWRVFELGPGPVLDSSGSKTRLLTNNGDIKLEMNSEIRLPIVKLFSGSVKLEGAGFVDAGNIWRYKDSSNNGITQFSFAKIPKDIAINTGFGLRFDFSLFLIRADYGIPIKQPYLTQNNGWVINNNSSKAWYKRNGVWQIGINYPF
jgi:outer membrane protein insertion porin family